MRFAPPPAIRVNDRGGGLNQTSVRTYNERLVMSLLRQHERLSRMDLCQRSGLSAQTISVIARALERDELIVSGEAQRGRVGPPTIPLSLRPDGAFAIGMKIGMRSTDLVLIDFVGAVRRHIGYVYDWPDAEVILARLPGDLAQLQEGLAAEHRERLVGIGIAVPEGIETVEAPGMPAAAMRRWSEIDFEATIGAIAKLAVHIQNDVTAAAGAEMIFGVARQMDDFAYFFVGASTTSRLALNHRIYGGRPVRSTARMASLCELDAAVAGGPGPSSAPIWQGDAAWPDYGAPLQRWIADCAADLAQAIGLLSGFVAIGTAIIDGRFPRPVAERLCAAVEAALAPTGSDIAIVRGEIGTFAKAIGAGGLCLHSRYMVEDVGLAGNS
jgi:predicted NBD/HSP70 family sugar kinase